MLEKNISIDKLIEVLQRVKARDGIETVTTFELLHILPSDEAVEQPLALDEGEDSAQEARPNQLDTGEGFSPFGNSPRK